MYGDLQHISIQSWPDIAYVMHYNGIFQTIPCTLGFQELDRLYWYLYYYPLKPLVFPKQPLPAARNPLTAP